MIKKVPSVCILLFMFLTGKTLNVTIIESQSYNPLMAMDNIWLSVITGMGHTGAIQPQTTLDNNLFFSTTDILIISSGVISIPSNRVNTIQQFLQTSKPVYLQNEYLPTLDANMAFATLNNNLGGNFTWTNIVSGTLAPMNVIGNLGTASNAVPPLSYFWYGVNGYGDCNTKRFLEFNGDYFGFQFLPPTPGVGTIITTTDQDWINSQSSIPLMENIITNLITPDGTGVPVVHLGNDTILCHGQSFTIGSVLQGATYLWNTGETSPTINVNGSYTYSVQITNGSCVYTDVIYVQFYVGPTVDFGDTIFVCDKETITLSTQALGTSYQWQDNSDESSYTVENSGLYWLTVSLGGCSDTDSVWVAIDDCEPEIIFPNVFSPGNDNTNDLFHPILMENIKSPRLSIYNRWGNKIFFTDSVWDGWNGEYQDQPCSEGTYYWVLEYIDLNDLPGEKQGFVTIMREKK